MESESRLPFSHHNDRISEWQNSCLSLANSHNNSKRERSLSLPTDEPASGSLRSGSPKRRRLHDSDDIQPEQSASQHAVALTLNTRNTFSPSPSGLSSGPQRSPSPLRDTKLLLEKACPPIITRGYAGLSQAPPQYVDALGDRLANGTNVAFIPHGLLDTIKNDLEVGYQPINSTDLNHSDERSSAELLALWKAVKDVFINARDCMAGLRDENAWCDDVVRPLIRLAIKLYGKGRWWMQSVQSQPINPCYLSAIPAPTPSNPTRCKTVDRQTDYILSYSHRDPTISALYKRLEDAWKSEIGYTLDPFTKRTAAFSNFEIKNPDGHTMEAQLQMSVGIAASLRKKQELAHAARVPFEPATMVEPAIVIVGHIHSVYYAYPQHTLASGGVHVLGPDTTRFGMLSTDSIRGIFQLVRVYGNILEYGMNEQDTGYWGRFLGPVLEALARP